MFVKAVPMHHYMLLHAFGSCVIPTPPCAGDKSHIDDTTRTRSAYLTVEPCECTPERAAEQSIATIRTAAPL